MIVRQHGWAVVATHHEGHAYLSASEQSFERNSKNALEQMEAFLKLIHGARLMRSAR